jgi:bifunctional UDP-N-acetylglucosamine pyrophosphorylase / glucosamine-1-phosphate N-acetyltransferase
MGGDLPKALARLGGEPILDHLLRATAAACPDPIIVVGYKGELVREHLGDAYRYAVQTEQLGTAHAVLCAEAEVKKYPVANVMVLYADHPFVQARTIEAMVHERASKAAAISMCVVGVPGFEDEWECFRSWSRVLHADDGSIRGVVEAKDATADQLLITDVNPCFLCFDPSWLWSNIRLIGRENANREYYLSDLINIAASENAGIAEIVIEPSEAIGVNSLAELESVDHLIQPKRPNPT